MFSRLMNWLKGESRPAGVVAASAATVALAQPGGKNVSEIATAHINNMVGPVMRQGELALAVLEAAQADNPGKKIIVDDKVAYLRIQTEDEMILRRQTIEEMLGRPFNLNQLEVDLASFSGRVETYPEYFRFYFQKHF
ncbi:MAG: MmoB/DmpM family protein [Pseudomonas sp.]